MIKNTHGGSRPNSGRKKKEPTTTVRIPVAIKPQVLSLKNNYLNLQKNEGKKN